MGHWVAWCNSKRPNPLGVLVGTAWSSMFPKTPDHSVIPWQYKSQGLLCDRITGGWELTSTKLMVGDGQQGEQCWAIAHGRVPALPRLQGLSLVPVCTWFSRVPFASTPYTIKMNHLHKSFKTTDALAHRYDIKSLRIEKSAKQESFQQDCKGFQTGKCVFNDG